MARQVSSSSSSKEKNTKSSKLGEVPLLQLNHIGLTFGGQPLLEDADLIVSPSDRLALVGRNGSGKSTLLRIASGLIEADKGERFVQGGIRIGNLTQEPDFSSFSNALAYASADLTLEEGDHAARFLLHELDIAPDALPATLSGGEGRRLALVRVLAPSPELLLLDEPTNHLDLPMIEWLEKELMQRQAAMVLISHDRRFLERLSNVTLWLDRGRTRRIERGFAEFEAFRDVILEEEEAAHHKLGRKIVDEEHWLRYGVSARRKRNVRRLADLHALRQSKRDFRRAEGKAAMQVAEEEKGGKLVLEVKNINKSFEGIEIIRDFSMRILHKDRIGIIGPNGAGKTTLINLLTGRLAPDGGSVRLSQDLAIAHMDQKRLELSPETTLKDALTGGGTDQIIINGEARHVMGYMKDFLFPPEKALSPLKILSGGERARLMLARVLARPSNLLVLDEPTNDLDMETLDVLQEMLAAYQGTVLLISHDRDFLDRVVDRVITPEGKGRWQIYAGGYSDMLNQRGADLAREERASANKNPPITRPQSPSPTKQQQDHSPRKLTLGEQKSLDSIPSAIEKLEIVIEKLQQKLDQPDLYTKDRKSFDEIMALLEKAQKEREGLEERWLALEMLREEWEKAQEREA